MDEQGDREKKKVTAACSQGRGPQGGSHTEEDNGCGEGTAGVTEQGETSSQEERNSVRKWGWPSVDCTDFRT